MPRGRGDVVEIKEPEREADNLIELPGRVGVGGGTFG
jgi:ribosomal protein S28E/S33